MPKTKKRFRNKSVSFEGLTLEKISKKLEVIENKLDKKGYDVATELVVNPPGYIVHGTLREAPARFVMGIHPPSEDGPGAELRQFVFGIEQFLEGIPKGLWRNAIHDMTKDAAKKFHFEFRTLLQKQCEKELLESTCTDEHCLRHTIIRATLVALQKEAQLSVS